MLLRFQVSNHRSLRDEQELSLTAAPLRDAPEATVEIAGHDLSALRAAGIFGANASGKSNVLKALQFVCDAVSDSHRHWDASGGVPRSPFLLDRQSHGSPSAFAVTFLLEHTIFEYGFEVNGERVLREWVHAWPQNRRQVWFSRTAQTFKFGKFLVGENQSIVRLTRPNSLFLSAAAQNNHQALTPLYRLLGEKIRFSFPSEAAERRLQTTAFCEDPAMRKVIARLLRAADIGITGVELVETPNDPRLMKAMEAALAALVESSEKRPSLPQETKQVVFLHQSSDAAEPVALPYSLESEGTVAYFNLLGPVLTALSSGGVLCVDELDSSIHPLLTAEIVRAFSSPEINDQNAQLIFNTHDVQLLSSGVLRRDQIWFTEKDDRGGTHLYSLHSYKPRKDESIERGYVHGRYGGVPYVEGLHQLMSRE